MKRGLPRTFRRSPLSLDIAYPTEYLLAESWERLRRAFYFVENLNAGADTVKSFAAAAMTAANAQDDQGTAALQVRRRDVARVERGDPGCLARTQARCAGRLLAHPAAAGRCAERQMGEHERPVRLLPARCGDVLLPADQPAGAGLGVGTAVRAALLHGPGARGGRSTPTAMTATARGSGGRG